MPTAAQKAKEYRDSAAEIEKRLSPSNRRSVTMRRENADNLERFYRKQLKRLKGVLAGL